MFQATTLQIVIKLDADMAVDFAQETNPDDVVTVIATRPLTSNEQWHAMKKGQFAVFHKGLLAYDKFALI